MNIKNERDLRRWLRLNWPGKIEWIEPARGATIGKADVELIWQHSRTPVELKYWRAYKRGGLKASLRPAQYRYHRMMLKAGIASYILFAYESPVGVFLALLPNKHLNIHTMRFVLEYAWPVTDAAALVKLLREGYER